MSEFDINILLKKFKKLSGQKNRIDNLKLRNEYIISNDIQFLQKYDKSYVFKNENALYTFMIIKNCFGEDIFDDLFLITRAKMFKYKYFAPLLDYKYKSIISLIDSIKIDESNSILCSKNLIMNIIEIFCYEIQDKNENFIRFHRSPFCSEITYNFMFILSLLLISGSKFKIEFNPSDDNYVHAIKYKNDVNIELNTLIEYEAFFNIVNKYFIVKNNTQFVFDNAVLMVEGINISGRDWGSGMTSEASAIKKILNDVCNYTVIPRPPRKNKVIPRHPRKNKAIPGKDKVISRRPRKNKVKFNLDLNKKHYYQETEKETNLESTLTQLNNLTTNTQLNIAFINDFNINLLKNSKPMCELTEIPILTYSEIDESTNNEDNSHKRKNDDVVQTLLSFNKIRKIS